MRYWWERLRTSGQFDLVHLLTILTLAGALLIGGGGAAGPMNNGIVLVIALFLMAAVLFTHFTGRRTLPHLALWPSLLILGVLLLGIFQLTALESAPWLDSPAREIERNLIAMFGPEAKRPLSIDTEATYRALAVFILPFALLLATLGATRGQVRVYLMVIIGAALIHALFAVMQVGLGYPEHLNLYQQGRYIPEPSGLFANANHFGTFMTIGILAVAALSAMPADSVRKHTRTLRAALKEKSTWALLLLVPLFALLVAAANTRAGIFLILLSVPVALVATLRLKVSLKLPLIFLLVPILLLVASVFSPQIQLLAIGERLFDSSDVRFAILPDLKYIVEGFWPWGTGLGGFDGAFRANENLDLVGPFYINHAHNDWIEWVLETGLAGAALLLGAIIAFAVLAFRAWRRSRHDSSLDRYLILIGATVLVAVGVHSLVDYPARMLAISASMAVFIAIAWLSWTAPRENGPVAGKGASWGIGLAVLLVTALLAVQIARIFSAEAAYREGRPSAAVALNPRHGEALAAIAARLDPAEEPKAVIRTARRAILERPYSGNAVRALAAALEADGNPANAAWPVAAALGWRDAPTQRWAFVQALETNQFEVAALRADALMRTKDEPDHFDQTLWQLSLVPDFRAALIKRLSLDPEWRSRWLAAGPSTDDRAIEGAIVMFRELAKEGPLDRYEVRGTLQRLITAQRRMDALALYDLVEDEGGDALLGDGGFDREAASYNGKLTPFDWNMRQGEGFLAQIEGRGNPYLFVESDGRDRYVLVDRMIGLDRGSYDLSFTAQKQQNDLGRLAVTLVCIGASQPLASITLQEGENRLAFDIPSDCPIVALVITSNIADSYITATMDDFRLARRSQGER